VTLPNQSGEPGIAAVDRMLAAARERIPTRVAPESLVGEMAAGALVVDIRPEALRRRDGELDGSVVIDRNVLEWRLDPTSPHRLDGMTDSARRVIIVCNEGYASSLAAAGLADLGLSNATDLAGGYQAWLDLRAP
jgi:rhodanese-related sulfurtransferase